MSKPKQSTVVGNCLCNCKKSNSTTYAGDNYNVMPNRIARLDENTHWTIKSSIEKFSAANDGSDPRIYAGENFFFSPNYLWPNVIDTFHTYIQSYRGLYYGGPLFENGNFDRVNFGGGLAQTNAGFTNTVLGTSIPILRWKDLLAFDTNYVADYVDDEDTKELSIKTTESDTLEPVNKFIFIPIYSEVADFDQEENPPTDYVEIGQDYGPASLEDNFPDLYQDYLEFVANNPGYGTRTWYESYFGILPGCLTDNSTEYQFEWEIYGLPTTFLTTPSGFVWYLIYVLGIAAHDPGPQQMNPGPSGRVCGWPCEPDGGVPRFKWYIHELLYGLRDKVGTKHYAPVYDIQDDEIYGYLIDCNDNITINKDTLRNARKVKIIKKTTQHFVKVTDGRDTAWVNGFNEFVNQYHVGGPLPINIYGYWDSLFGEFGTYEGQTLCDIIDDPNLEIVRKFFCYPAGHPLEDEPRYPSYGDEINDLHRSKLEGLLEFDKITIEVDGQEFPLTDEAIAACPYSSSPIGNSFNTYEYSIEDLPDDFFDDIVSFTDSGDMYVREPKIAEVLGVTGNSLMTRSAIGVRLPRFIYELTSTFTGPDTYTNTDGSNDFGTNPDHTIKLLRSEFSAYDYIRSSDVYPTSNIVGAAGFYHTDKFELYTPMIGSFNTRTSLPFVDEELKYIGCKYTQPETNLLAISPGQIANPDAPAIVKVNGWIDRNYYYLYCPKNSKNCSGWVDVTNLTEGRAADNLIVSDFYLRDATVSELPKYVKHDRVEYLLSDYQNKDDDDILDLTNTVGIVYDIITQSFYMLKSALDSDPLEFSDFETAQGFYNGINTLLLDYIPLYFADDEGLSSIDKIFLRFDYMVKGVPVNVYQTVAEFHNDYFGAHLIGTEAEDDLILIESNQYVSKLKRTFKGVDNTNCNDGTYKIENVRGFPIGNGWIDERHTVTASYSGFYSNGTQKSMSSIKKLIPATGSDPDKIYFESLDNFTTLPNYRRTIPNSGNAFVDAQPYVVYMITDIYMNIDSNGTITVRVVTDYTDEEASFTPDNICMIGIQGFNIEVGYPLIGITITSPVDDIQVVPFIFNIRPEVWSYDRIQFRTAPTLYQTYDGN